MWSMDCCRLTPPCLSSFSPRARSLPLLTWCATILQLNISPAKNKPNSNSTQRGSLVHLHPTSRHRHRHGPGQLGLFAAADSGRDLLDDQEHPRDLKKLVRCGDDHEACEGAVAPRVWHEVHQVEHDPAAREKSDDGEKQIGEAINRSINRSSQKIPSLNKAASWPSAKRAASRNKVQENDRLRVVQLRDGQLSFTHICLPKDYQYHLQLLLLSGLDYPYNPIQLRTNRCIWRDGDRLHPHAACLQSQNDRHRPHHPINGIRANG